MFVETNLHSTAIIIALIIKPFGFNKNHAVKIIIFLSLFKGNWWPSNNFFRFNIYCIMRNLCLKN